MLIFVEEGKAEYGMNNTDDGTNTSFNNGQDSKAFSSICCKNNGNCICSKAVSLNENLWITFIELGNITLFKDVQLKNV